MKSPSHLSLPLLLVLVGCPKEGECPAPPLATAELRVATRAVSDSLVVLDDALIDLGLDHTAQRALNRRAEESYAPWGVDAPDERLADNPLFDETGTSGVNPLFEAPSLRSALGDDLPGLAAPTTAAELAAARDRAAAWQGWLAALASAEQIEPAWSAPAVRAATVATWMDLAGTRCALATLAAGDDAGLDTCTAAADVLATTAYVVGLADVTWALREDQATRHATLVTVRDLAVAYLDAVGEIYLEGDALDLATALVVEANAAVAATDATSGVGGLADVLATEAPALDTGMDELRRALRDATLHTAAHEAAHVVQQRGAALDAVFALDAGFEGCADEGLDCALAAARAKVHGLHRGEHLPAVEEAARVAFAAAADKAPIPEARAALKAALAAADAQFLELDATTDVAARQLQTLSNASRTRHDTAKNSVGNIR